MQMRKALCYLPIQGSSDDIGHTVRVRSKRAYRFAFAAADNVDRVMMCGQTDGGEDQVED
jgi:hypothetical protein